MMGLQRENVRAIEVLKMLASLDQIPWSTLEHAYGDAGDVPNLIRALVSSDPNKREWAQEMLEMGPFHQGSIYSCTPFVVHFLMEIVQEHDAHDRPWILQYVSRVLASALCFLPGPETLAQDPEDAIAKQVVSEIHPHVLSLFRLLEDSDANVRLSLLRLLVHLKADLPHLDRVLAERLKVETQESIRGAFVFCLSLLAYSSTVPPMLAMLETTTESPMVRLAAGFGVIAASEKPIPDRVVSEFCAVIANNYDALDRFDEIYAEYLTPLGAPQGKDRLLECLQNGLTSLQKDQIAKVVLSIYAQLPAATSFGTRIGYAYYLEAMVRLAFPEGKLPPETTIRDLNDTQRSVLEAFQQYDMPSVTWNNYYPDDYRMVLGLSFRSETDFLDFMAGKRAARQTK